MRALRPRARLAVLSCLLVAWTGLALARPSWACGCGAMVTAGGEDLVVGQETSIVRYDDRTRTEQIVMRLTVSSRAPDAAWLLPTPSAAAVELGDRAWFDQLEALTRPRVVVRRDWWSGFDLGDGSATGGAPEGVRVLGERRLGPFQVATLDAGDPGALADWLRSNGYRLDDRLAEGLEPYVRLGWTYVAVKLAPGAGRSLNGDLDPLRVTFRSDEIVYPMRLSRLAETDQHVRLYVLGAHRVRHEGPRGLRSGVAFAGWVEPRQVASPGLREFLGGRMFLTEVVQQHLRPETIDGDFRYRYTADAPYRETVYRDEHVQVLGVPAGWAATAAAVVLAGGGAGAAVSRARRRSAG